ncbi:MAG: hypothetical protein K0R47_296 [Brevibacillus sp.]|nr:hypothetical protein [Brevibacillus sp.]
MTSDQIEYSIRFNQELLKQEEEFLVMARDQLKQHYQELNIRKKATSARQSIDYLEKHFIPDAEERLEAIKRHIEIRKLQLTGLSHDEARTKVEFVEGDQQMELSVNTMLNLDS